MTPAEIEHLVRASPGPLVDGDMLLYGVAYEFERVVAASRVGQLDQLESVDVKVRTFGLVRRPARI